MIGQALTFITSVLNHHLVNRFDLDSPIVVLNSLVDSTGSLPQKNQNKVVLTLINLEHETSKQFYGNHQATRTAKQVSDVFPAVRFNLDILLTASFDVYEESLKFLTETIAFFQAHPSLTEQLFPTMPAGLAMLNFEIENSPYAQTHNLWTSMGAKYQPSVIYKIRHVTVDSEEIRGTTPTIQGVDVKAAS